MYIFNVITSHEIKMDKSISGTFSPLPSLFE